MPVYRSILRLDGNFVVGAKRDMNDAILVGAVMLEAALAEDIKHVTIRRHHLGGKFLDAAGVRDTPQMLEQQRRDAAALVFVEHRERDLGAGAILQAIVAAHPDEALLAILGKRRGQTDLVVEIELGEAREFVDGRECAWRRRIAYSGSSRSVR